MKIHVLKNIRALLTSRQFTVTGDQLGPIFEVLNELAAEEALLSQPPVVAVPKTDTPLENGDL